MTRPVLVLVALFVGAAGVAACGSSSKSSSATDVKQSTRSSTRTITLTAVEHDVSIKEAGTTVTIVNDLMSNGKKIGEGQLECFLSGRGGTGLCLGAATLPDGEILNQGSLPVPPPVGTSVDAIVGGTGTYATARGTIALARTSLSGDTNLTFHIVIDA